MSQWWKGALIYQIYPRSFFDSNNDGIGDLPGITQKLEYVASLGVDAIWISPFFTSPMKDFGYDIADYCSVDPIFGTLEDFKVLLDHAHKLGLKIIIDQVISHSSDQHAWFQESRQSKTNSKADWYVWADPKPDGSPPNNWLSFFGGSAWTFDEARGQYYLHNFLTSQPDLNFHNPAVQDAQLGTLQFWLDLGVDGFRLDVANFYFHDAALRDNPELPESELSTVGVDPKNPYARQQHIYDMTRPENLDFLKRMRELMDSYPGTMTMGEVNGEYALDIIRDYTNGDDRLHMAYTFDLLSDDASPSHIRKVIDAFSGDNQAGWPCWALGNHDVIRVATRWGKDTDNAAYALVAMALLSSLNGTQCLYQGDELGLPEANVPFDDIVDPYGKPFWPDYKGRDGCRTPMPWTDAEHGGFTTASPWLPTDERHLALAVEQQDTRIDSTLNAIRRFVLWRQAQPALVKGSLTLLDDSLGLAWLREAPGQKMLVCINLNHTSTTLTLPDMALKVLQGHGFHSSLQNNTLTLPAYQAFFAEIKTTDVNEEN
ncbi:alpha-glucosidase [Alteromonas antoniana]|uniref:alpha-glucosidase n=1 Tax=Alteromonas antoniana TaxID=2803813 RepID=UPI001C44DCB8|nr:alpha-glucosidase [Alteromonas antoniana]